MYTPAQVSEMLKVPPSSLRRYSSLFAAHLSPQYPGKKRSYTESDIAVLARVRDLARTMPLDKIGAVLGVVDTSPAPKEENSLALIPTISRALERLDAANQAANKELSDLRAAYQADHERLARLEAWASLPWWRKLLTTPPK